MREVGQKEAVAVLRKSQVAQEAGVADYNQFAPGDVYAVLGAYLAFGGSGK